MTDILLPIASHHCRTTHSACECVLKTLTRYTKALEWYATEGLYQESHSRPVSSATLDGGNIARQALAKGAGDE